MTVSPELMTAPHAHLPQRDPACDTVKVLNMAALRRPGRRVADMNEVAGLDEDWNFHWIQGPELNHFTHRFTGRYRRTKLGVKVEILERMPAQLHHKPVLETPEKEIRTWRKNVGTAKRPRWVKPFTIAERQVQANRRRVAVGWEAKSPAYVHAQYAARAVASLKKVGGHWFQMTLVNMFGWAQKLTAFKNAGSQTELLAHGQPKPDDLHVFHPGVIDVIDGRWAA